ncbi:nucleotidyltransferase domain-containing protein [Spirosoma rhododendri]|uniref:Nucleotidyltransferase domain-containing protein n=1 Tax=Spirosoma rhododendri TaxID=2728024 RepID=A0A7L5DI87_9BACT|nr:nucleotidyltransferase domain-containing protein [Spirosoma rhododendri]QJD78094.1 nucleotidyltransferase domain-containing protein [Spirosoma rhododendri]
MSTVSGANLDAIHSNVIRVMQELYSDRLAKILLYGSYARGDYHDKSDIDYLVVLNDDTVSTFTEVNNIAPALYKTFGDNSIDISAFAVSNKQLATSAKPFFKEVRRDAQIIYEQ